MGAEGALLLENGIFQELYMYNSKNRAELEGLKDFTWSSLEDTVASEATW